MSCVRPTGRLSCVAKTKLFNQFFFMPAMLVCTVDFYHFIPLSLTLTLPVGHNVNEKQNLLASFSPKFLSLSD